MAIAEVYANHETQPKIVDAISSAWEHAFYRRHWRVGSLQEVLAQVRAGNVHEIPVMRKEHLRAYYDEITDFGGCVDVVSSSGTTGRPVDIPLHKEELDNRVMRVTRVLGELGVGPGARVLQLLSLNDLFTLGPQAWLAVGALGACGIRCTTQRLDRALLAIKHLRPDTVIGNPHAMLRMVEEAGERWPAPDDLPSRAFLGVTATFDSELRLTPVVQALAKKWGLTEILNHYGSSELGAVAYECSAHQGLHIHDDCHHVELVDPATGEPLDDPEQSGEIVVTALSLPRGFIPIRYATGDVAAWLRTEPCACGRRSARLGPIIGRVDHQLRVLGQTMYPEMLLEVVDRISGVHRAAVQVKLGAAVSDEVTVLFVNAPGTDPANVRNEVTVQLARNLVISPKVELATEDDILKLERMSSAYSNLVKIPRFFDLRGGK